MANINTINGNNLQDARVDNLSKVASSGSYSDLTNKPSFKTINNQAITGSGNITISSAPSNTVTQNMTNSGAGVAAPINADTLGGTLSKDNVSMYEKVGNMDFNAPSIINILHPIDSVYLSYSNINPSQLFYGTTWALQGMIYPDGHVVGNGLALGLTDGSTKYGLIGRTSDTGNARTGTYGKNVGTSISGSDSQFVSLGVPTKSQLGSNLDNSGLIVSGNNPIYSWRRVA